MICVAVIMIGLKFIKKKKTHIRRTHDNSSLTQSRMKIVAE